MKTVTAVKSTYRMTKMKRIYLYILPVWLILVVFPGPILAISLTIVTDNTPGGNYIRGGGLSFDEDRPGIEIELYQMVADELGLELTIRRQPWALCLQLLENNVIDGIFPASFKKERMAIGRYPMIKGVIDPSRKTRNNAYYLYKTSESKLSWNGSDFSGLSGNIGVPLGWAIVDDMRKRKIPIKEVSLHPNSPDMLILGRLQGFICLEPVFDNYLNRKPEEYRNIVKVVPPIWEKPYYLMLSHHFVEQHPETAEDIWNTIREIKKTPAYAEIIRKYVD